MGKWLYPRLCKSTAASQETKKEAAEAQRPERSGSHKQLQLDTNATRFLHSNSSTLLGPSLDHPPHLPDFRLVDGDVHPAIFSTRLQPVVFPDVQAQLNCEMASMTRLRHA